MTHVVVDPVTRIEGHLRIEAEVDGGKVKDAWSSSTMFRGIEIILKGRDPRDAWAFTQRICGVCTTVHAIASIRAVENAIGAVPPPNARLLRNLIIASQCVQDHVIHFYHLHALDWVDIVSALSADPAKTSALAQSISDWPLSSTKYFAGVQRPRQGVRRARTARSVRQRLLGPPRVQAAARGQPDGRRALPRGARLAARVHPHPRHSRRQEPAPAELPRRRHGDADRSGPARRPSTSDTIAGLQELIAKAQDFVTRVYIPDLLAVASFYKDWAGYGGGRRQLPRLRRVSRGRRAERPHCSCRPASSATGTSRRSRRFDPSKITEQVTALLVRVSGRRRTRGCTPLRARRSPSTPAPSRPTSGWTRPRSTAG